MTRIVKRIYYAILSFILSFLVVVGVSPATFSTSAEETPKSVYEQTNVLDDLKKATINNQAFDLSTYNFDEKKETKVLSFVEYCYSFYTGKQDNYGLYIYVYNPKGLKFNKYSPLNTIQFAINSETAMNFTKYNLKYLNSSTETNYEGLFYKFKVDLTDAQTKKILTTVNSTERIYRVSGIELVTSGDVNATEYTVATTYKYSGYAAGYGSNESAKSTLVCNTEETEVLTLDVHATQYRPSGTNGKNEYTQDSLHSVYFAVPNEIINRYGAMSAVHATWLDAVLKPALVTGNQTAYEAIKPLLGKSIKNLSTFSYMYLGAYAYQTNGEAGSLYLGGYTYYNEEPLMRNDDVLNYYYGKDIDTLYSLYYAGGGTDSADHYTLSSEEILANLKASASKYGGVLVNGKYSKYMFESVAEEWTDVNIKADETFSLTDEIIDKSWWDKFWGLKGEVTTNTFDGIKAIYAVKDSDLSGSAAEVAKRLYISEADYAEFSNFYNANKAENTVYLFRYQVSDYIAQEATLLKENTSIFGDSFKKVDTNAYFFQQTVNLDFDIIDVTFSNGEKDTVIPVVSNPIDVVPDVTPPVYTTTDEEGMDWLKLLKITIALILIVVMLIFAWPLVKPLFVLIGKGIAWLITAPFKAIGQAIKKRKERKEDDEENG